MAQPKQERLAELQASVEARLKRYDERDLANYQEAVAGGKELIEIRAILAETKYGEWGRWLNSVFIKSRSTAYDWIEVAEGQEDLSSAGQTPTSVREAKALIGQLRAKGDDRPSNPEPLPAAILRQHDVVLLGRHVLICGDASVMKVGMGLAGKGRPRLLVTDPPYGIQIDAWDVQSDWREVWDRYPGDAGYVFFEATLADEVLAGLKAAGFKIVDDMVWRKTWGHKVGSLLHRHEMIYLVTFGGKPFPRGEGSPAARLCAAVRAARQGTESCWRPSDAEADEAPEDADRGSQRGRRRGDRSILRGRRDPPRGRECRPDLSGHREGAGALRHHRRAVAGRDEAAGDAVAGRARSDPVQRATARRR